MSNLKNMGEKNESRKPIVLKKPDYAYAGEVEPRLKECKKFSLEDRESFAKNLGKMIDEVRRTHDANLRKLFMDAFGQSADSLYKKRKSLVTLPGEKAEPDKLRSKARDYLSIIDALVPYSKFSTVDDLTSRRTLLLKFIQGSSYENHTTVSDRMTASFKKEISTQLDKVTEKVLQQVSLDSMYEWYRNHAPWAGLEFQYAYNSGTSAPSVRIGEVFTKVPSCSVLQLEVQFEGVDTESPEEVVRAIQLALLSTYGDNDHLRTREMIDLITKSQAEKDEFTDGLYQEADYFGVNYLPKDEDEWTTELDFFSVRSYVDLELRYSSDWRSWEPFLFWRTGQGDPVLAGEDELVFEGLRDNATPQPALKIAEEQVETLYAVTDFRALKYINQSSRSLVVELFQVDNFSWESLIDYRFLGAENLISIAELAGDLDDHYGEKLAKRLDSLNEVSKNEFMFSSVDEDNNHNLISLLSPPYETRHVPAPSGSFAQLILRNLAYAPAEHRIDNLMLADAQEKYAAFEKLAAEKEAEYRNAIESL